MVVEQGNVTFLLSERSWNNRDDLLSLNKPDNLPQPEPEAKGKLGDQKKGQSGGDLSDCGDQNGNQQERTVCPTIQEESEGEKTRSHEKSKVYPWLSPLCKLPVDTLFNVCLEVNVAGVYDDDDGASCGDIGANSWLMLR